MSDATLHRISRTSSRPAAGGRHPRRHRLAAVVLSGAVAACLPADRAADAVASDTLVPPPYSVETMPADSPVQTPPPRLLPERPAELADSVRIEGEWQRSRLTLVRSPEGFEPPFSTYVPDGLRTTFELSDSSTSVRFVAAFAGRPNPEAYLHIRIYPPGTAERVVRNQADAFLISRDPRRERVTASQGWPWTSAAWDFQYGGGAGRSGYMGTMGIARYGDRYFHVLAHYPADYGDGVGPRFERILREWRWETDGARLVE